MRQHFLLLLVVGLVRAAQQHNLTVAAYLPEWRYEGANWEDISATVNQLILFSLEVSPIGRLQAFDRLPRRELMAEARAATRAAGSKLLVCIGGNGRSAGFSPAVANKEKRARFVESLVSLADKYDLDGVDLNWEYPGYDFRSGYASDDILQKDYKGLKLLLKGLHAAFEPAGRIITIAYYPDGKQERLFVEHGFGRYVAAMHMMSYDQGGRHSTWDFAQQVAHQGAALLPAHLVTLGLPFYGRHMKTGEWKSYEDLVQMLHPIADDVDEGEGYYFNGPKLIRRKTALARQLGLGGVMIWEVGQDCRMHEVTHGETTHAVTCPDGERSSLLDALRSELQSGGQSPEGNGRDEL
jgi:chitinase